MKALAGAAFAALIAAMAGPVRAQDENPPEPIPFAGGTLTITQPKPDAERVLAFEGRELARNYFVALDQIAEVGGVEVAVFDVGDGGNACGPAAVLVWKPEDEALKTLTVGADECGAPPAAVTGDAIYFVPWLMPGGSEPVRRWSPTEGMALAGNLTYMADPGTGWDDVAKSYDTIMDAFHNEAVYETAQALLGDKLGQVTTALLVGGGTESTDSGIVYGRGCVPHACGGSDGFMAIDAAGEKLYFAQEVDGPEPDAWPALDQWPEELRAALKKAFEQPQ